MVSKLMTFHSFKAVDVPLDRVRKVVYRDRIRVKEFFADFDKLRTGNITAAQFKSGLSMSGVMRAAELTSVEMDELADMYRVPVTEDRCLVAGHDICYFAFCDDVNSVFTLDKLEKDPLKLVSMCPPPLGNGGPPALDPVRYKTLPRETLMPKREASLLGLLERIKTRATVKRILVRPFFEDAAKNFNSPMRVNRVTHAQFKQALKSHVYPDATPAEMELLVDKFDPEGDGMVNYVAFSSAVDPPPKSEDPFAFTHLSLGFPATFYGAGALDGPMNPPPAHLVEIAALNCSI